MGKKTKEIPEIGQEYGRPDMERIGLFAELGYLVGKKYTPTLQFSKVRDLKGRQMFPGGIKIKTGLQDCFFDVEFKRLFIGEGYPRKRKDGQDGGKKKKKVKDLGPLKPFVPSKYPNPLYYMGDAFGYFSYLEEFSPKTKPKERMGKIIRGIYTNPAKFGGPGYADMCMNPFPEHMPDKYDAKDKKPVQIKKFPPLHTGQQPDFFDPNPFIQEDNQSPYRKLKEIYVGKMGPTFRLSSPAKWDGGCKDGTFEKFPEYIEDRYNDPHKIDKVLEKIKKKKMGKKKEVKIGPAIRPPGCCRTLQTPSIMSRKAKIGTHAGNWTDMMPVTYNQRFVVL